MNGPNRAAPSAMPTWAIIVLAIEAVLFSLFALYGWGETYANARGRQPSVQDFVLFFAPLVLTIVCGVAAVRLARRGKPELAGVAGLSPIALTVFVLPLLGAI